MALKIQQIPAPSFGESKRADFIQSLFVAEGLADIQRDHAGNVLARLPGADRAAPLVVSAHMDTVFPVETDLAYRYIDDRLYGPGIGDNSMGIAGLFGLIWGVRERGIKLAGDIWLAANTCGEGLGNLRGMRGIDDEFVNRPQLYLVLDGRALGHTV